MPERRRLAGIAPRTPEPCMRNQAVSAARRTAGVPPSRRHRAKNTRAVYGKPSRQGGMSEPLAPPASRRHRAKNTRAVYAKPSRQRGPWERRHRGAMSRPVSSLQYVVAAIPVASLSRSTGATDARTAARFVEGRGVLDVGCRRDAGSPREARTASACLTRLWLLRRRMPASIVRQLALDPAVRHAVRTALALRRRLGVV
jgi:hypothetical protein